MSTPTFSNKVRLMILHDTSETAARVLSDDKLELYREDAVTETKQSDDLALRRYVCFLIANDWESIGAVASREGVTYREPIPQKFLDLYNKRVNSLGKSAVSSSSPGLGTGLGKVSTDRDYKINSTNNLIERNYTRF